MSSEPPNDPQAGPSPERRLTVRFPVYSLHFTPDGHWLRFVGQDNSTATYDWCSNSQIATTTEKSDQCLTAVSGQGRWLAARARQPSPRL